MDDPTSQFLKICGISSRDDAIAAYYLELTNGNLETAVNLYFEDIPAHPSTSVISTPARNSASASSDFHASLQSKQIAILQWNVQGLLDTNLRERMVAIANDIQKLMPDVVMMQEVVDATFRYFQSVCDTYEVVSPYQLTFGRAPYFTLLMLRKSTFQIKSKMIIPFASSAQGRDLTIVSGTCCNAKLTVMTSHLESTREGSSRRTQQLMQVCEIMKNQSPADTVIFGADTNLRDWEVDKARKQSSIVANEIEDVWEKLGSPSDTKYSWDCSKNDNQLKDSQVKLRFERLFMRRESPKSAKHFQPTSMKFIGTERLPCGLFPSDHWGMWVEMKLPEQ